MKALSLLPALLLLACNGGDGGTDGTDDSDTSVEPAVAGLYQITVDQSAPDCRTYVDAVLPIPFFRIVGVDGAVEVRVCRTATDCDDFAGDGMTLVATDTGWKGIDTWAHWQDDNDACIFDARRTTLKEKAGGKIALESIQVETFGEPAGQGAPDDAACEQALTDWTPTFQSDTLGCWKREATRVE